MEDTLCNISAFRLMNTPPQILALCPPVPPHYADRHRTQLKRHFLYTDILKPPIHVQTATRKKRFHSECIKSHLQTQDLPAGSGVLQTPFGLEYSAPLPTLLSLAQSLNDVQLMIAMYELCGSFSIFTPTPRTEEILENAYQNQQLRRRDGWRRVIGADGTKSNLWSRPPLISIDDLVHYARNSVGMRGHKRLLRVAESITGTTASPFEAQASIFLSLSRRKGGCGRAPLYNNLEITLDCSARALTGKARCYADLAIDRGPDNLPLIIECQGKLVHDNRAAAISDSERSTALQSMGYDVVFLTYQQMADPRNFETIDRLISQKLGQPYRPKTPHEREREESLRYQLLGDWEHLCP